MTSETKSDSAGVYLIPPIIFLLCLTAGISATAIYGQTALLSWPLAISSGVIVVAASISFMGWGHGRFKKLGVEVKTFKPASQLVTDGAHGISRNPMYVGFVGILIGLAWAAQSFGLLIAAAVMFAYLNFYVIRREEAYLTRRFGEDYNAYCSRVRRWL